MEGVDRMSKSIDTKVVEMKFNNKQFESGIKQTLNTLERFKKALSSIGSSKKDLDISKSIKTDNLDRIANSVEALQKRFSFLGETVRNVVNNIVSSLTGTLSKGLNFVSDSIVQGGIRRAMNLENAHFQLQALLKEESKVQEVMDAANKAVDGTAYSFDEAAKAASMFAASGIKVENSEMLDALRGIVGTAAMTNQEFERISLIFTSVAGQGRLMGDQLLQLSSMGLNAPATIAAFFNGVNDGSKKASEGVTKAVKEISKGKKMAEGDIRDLVSEGSISFKIFSEAMTEAFADSAEKANETFTGSISNIKAALARIGAGFISPLVEQNSKIVKLFNTIREAVNTLKSTLVFDESIGNVDALSKRFTDSVLKMAKVITKFIKGLDIVGGMQVFYNVFDSVLNVFKGILSVVKPVAKAIADVFFSFTLDDVGLATNDLLRFTDGLKLSENASKNLYDATKGVSDILKLFVDIIIGAVKAIFPLSDTVTDFNGGLLELLGSVGRVLSEFAKWVKETGLVKAATTVLGSGVKIVGNVISKVISVVVAFIKRLNDMGAAAKVVNMVVKAFQNLYQTVVPYVEKAIDAIVRFGKSLIGFLPDDVKGAFKYLGEQLQALAKAAYELNSGKIGEIFRNIKEKLDGLLSTMNNLHPIKNFVENLKGFGQAVKDAFDFSKITDTIKAFQDLVGGFVKWFKSITEPVFSQFSFGGALAGAGGLGIIYGVIKISKSLEKALSTISDSVSKTLAKIPTVLGSVNDTLKAYQRDLNASALIKLAGAIAILAGSLVILSFVDTDKLLQASTALSLIAGVLILSFAKLEEALNKGNTAQKSMNTLARSLGSAIKNFGKSLKIKTIGNTVKSFGTTIALIAGSLIALGIMYKTNEKDLDNAVKLVASIAAVIAGIMVAMTVINDKLKDGGSGFLKSALAIFAITAALTKVIGALQKMFKLEIPQDWSLKMGIFEMLLLSLGGLVIALGVASKLAGSGKIKTGPLLAVCAGIFAITTSLGMILKMDVPDDWLYKLDFMALAYGSLGALIIAVGYAGKLAGGALKATGALLALAADIVVITGSLIILSIMPTEGLLKGSVALSAVLLALAGGIYAAGQVTNENAQKTVLSMAITVGAIVAALGALSFVPMEQLLVSATALGGILLALAVDFSQIAKISGRYKWTSIVAMIGVIVSIAGSLFLLSQQPWDGMLAAATSMSLALGAFAIAFNVIGKTQNIDIGKVSLFLATTLAVIPIGVALYTLSQQPWQSMIAAGGALALALTAFGTAFTIISKSNPNLSAVVGFVAAAVALIPISAALNMLAGQSWSSILPGAVALGSVLAEISVALVLVSHAQISLPAVVAFVGAAVSLIPIAAAINALKDLSWEQVAKGLITLAGALTVIGVAGAVMGPLAPMILAMSAALLVFSAAIAAVGAGLVIFVSGLTTSLDVLGQFIESLGGLSGLAEAGRNFVQGFINGIVEGFTSLVDTVKSMAQGVVNTVCDVLGIHSPSTVAENIARFFDQGFANGIQGGSGEIDSSIDSVFGNLSEKIDTSSLFGTGQEATKNFGDGLQSGESNIDNIMSNIADASGLDLSSFNIKGSDSSSLFGDGLLGGSGSVDEALKNLTDTTGVDLSGFGDMGTDASDLFGGGLEDGSSSVEESVRKMTDVSKVDTKSFKKLGNDASKDFVKGFQTGAKNSVNEAAEKVSKMLADAVSTAVKGTNFKSSGKEAITQIASGMKSQTELVTSAVNNITKNALKAIKENDSGFKSKGTSLMNSFVSGLKSKSEQSVNTVKNITKKILNAVQENAKGFQNKGKSLMESFEKGLKGEKSKSISTIKSILDSLIKTIESKKSSFTKSGTTTANAFVTAMKNALTKGNRTLTQQAISTGKAIVDGVTKGIKNNQHLVSNAAKQLAQNVDKQIKTTLEIHSPSKVGEKRGKQWDEGVAQGIDKFSDLPITASKKIATGINQALSDATRNTAESLTKILQTKVKPIYTQFEKTVKAYNDYWNRLYQIKINGQDAEKYADMSFLDFRKDILTQHHTIMEEYEENRKQWVESAKNELNLFSDLSTTVLRTRQEQAKAEKEEAAALEKMDEKEKERYEASKNQVKSIKEISKDRIKIAKEYSSTMQSLYKKLKGSDLWDVVKDMGVADIAWLKELDGLTKKQLEIIKDNFDTANDYLVNASNFKHMDDIKNYESQIQQIYDLREKNRQKREESSGKEVETEKNYWEALLAAKQAGADREKYLEMDVQAFREEILAQTQEVVDKYVSTYENIRDGLVEQMDILSGVSQKTVVSFEDIQKATDQNLKDSAEYARVMQDLEQKVGHRNLWTRLSQIGVESLDQLKEINGQSVDTILAWADDYDKTIENMGVAATTKMGEVTEECKEALQEIYDTPANIDVSKFVEFWDGTIDSVEGYMQELQKPIEEGQTKMGEGVLKIVETMGTNLDTGMQGLAVNAGGLAQALVAAMAGGFDENTQLVVEASDNMVDATEQPIEEAQPEFVELGDQSASSYVEGINTVQPEANSAGEEIANEAIQGADTLQPQFTQEGTVEGVAYAEGISSTSGDASAAGAELGNAAVSGIGDNSSAFYNAGVNAGSGFVSGLRSQVDAARMAAQEFGNITVEQTEETLDINSPSKRMATVGRYAALGFINQLLLMVTDAAKAGEALGEASLDGAEDSLRDISTVITDEMFRDPVLKPEVDLSVVKKSAKEVQDLFNTAISKSSSNIGGLDDQIYRQSIARGAIKTEPLQKEKSSGGDTFNFTQNNYSPKALSQIDIYRQTKNQFSMFRRVVQN